MTLEWEGAWLWLGFSETGAVQGVLVSPGDICLDYHVSFAWNFSKVILCYLAPFYPPKLWIGPQSPSSMCHRIQCVDWSDIHTNNNAGVNNAASDTNVKDRYTCLVFWEGGQPFATYWVFI